MQIVRPSGADDTEKWTQFAAGRNAERARRSPAGNRHQSNRQVTDLTKNICLFLFCFLVFC